MTFKNGLEWACKLKIFVISLFYLELLVIESRCGVYVFNTHIEELWKTLSSHEILGRVAFLLLDLKYSVAPADVLDKERTE